MKKLNSVWVLAIAVVALAGASAAWAHVGATPQAHSSMSMTARGELVKVDMDSKQLVIKDADGIEQTFRYTDRTEVTGSKESVAGLATKTGSRVIVHYTGEKAERTATKIEVLSEN